MWKMRACSWLGLDISSNYFFLFLIFVIIVIVIENALNAKRVDEYCMPLFYDFIALSSALKAYSRGVKYVCFLF